MIVKMGRPATLDSQRVVEALRAAGPAGLGAEALGRQLPETSRSTLTRRLNDLVAAGEVRTLGRGRSLRYIAVGPHALADVRHYFATDWQSRPTVGFTEDLLQPTPALDAGMARRLAAIQALARAPDRKFLSDFLIDFSWASAVLEGSTYSSIDTQALIEYGERNADKPLEDAVLILNHKNAIQWLWAHREPTVANLCAMQAMLTDDHGLAEVRDSDHFLPQAQRGVVREYEDVRLGRSAYSPPFRPGTGYIAQALEALLATAAALPPIQAAFHLMTRIPYLQAFANGNKRTARLAANLPLLRAGLLPISFVDFGKADYVLGMSSFYELGDIQIMQRVFVDGYVRSIVRGSDIPAARRVAGFDVETTTRELARFVRGGTPPGADAAIFLKREG